MIIINTIKNTDHYHDDQVKDVREPDQLMSDHANVYPADIDHDYDDHHVKHNVIIMMIVIMISR